MVPSVLDSRYRGSSNESADGNSAGAVLVSNLEGGGGFVNLALPRTEEKDRLRVVPVVALPCQLRQMRKELWARVFVDCG